MLGMLPPFATSQVRLFLYAKNVDMRKSFDGLHAIVQSEFRKDVRLGDVFLFLNRRLDRLKLICWDRDGLLILYKRLESGTFQRPAPEGDSNHVEIDITELALLLTGIDLSSAKRRKRYVMPGTTPELVSRTST